MGLFEQLEFTTILWIGDSIRELAVLWGKEAYQGILSNFGQIKMKVIVDSCLG